MSTTPEPSDLKAWTIAAYFKRRNHPLDLDTAKRVGGFAAAAWKRAHRGEPAPKVKEFHVGLGGLIDVSSYPPPLGPEIMDRALREVWDQDQYKAPPPPPG